MYVSNTRDAISLPWERGEGEEGVKERREEVMLYIPPYTPTHPHTHTDSVFSQWPH